MIRLICISFIITCFGCQIKPKSRDVISHNDSIARQRANFSEGIQYLNGVESSYLLFASREYDSLFVFNSSNGFVSTPIPYDENGESVRGFCFRNSDEILLMYFNKCLVIDRNGKILMERKFPNPMKKNGHSNFVLSDLAKHLIPLNSSNQVLLSQIDFDHSYWENEFYSFPIECFISLGDSAFTDSKLFYPEVYKTQRFADAIRYWAAYDGKERICYSFEASAELSVLNTQDGNVTKVMAHSDFDRMNNQPYPVEERNDFNKIADYKLESSFYGPIHYDRYRNCYYRFFSPGMKLQNEDGSFNSVVNKSKVLMILDSDFQILSEIELDKNLFTDWSYVDKNGLHIKLITDSTYNENEYFYFKVFSLDRH